MKEFGPQRLRAAIPPGPVPPPHRPLRHPQVVRDLADRLSPGEPPRLPPAAAAHAAAAQRPYTRLVAHTAYSGHTPAASRRHDPISMSSSWCSGITERNRQVESMREVLTGLVSLKREIPGEVSRLGLICANAGWPQVSLASGWCQRRIPSPSSETEVIGPRLVSARGGGSGLMRDPRR
jgi:hypothetical protein